MPHTVEDTTLEKVKRLQEILIAEATGKSSDGGDPEYTRLRAELLQQPNIRKKLPSFVQNCRDLYRFWHFIKHKFGTYAERREFLWDNFDTVINHLENSQRTPGQPSIDTTLKEFNIDQVHEVWMKAQGRCANDPEGAITAARTLIESVCKHILDDSEVSYSRNIDLPVLWKKCAEKVNLSPSQHDEKIFKQILGGCQTIVNSLGTLRNKVGDAHGTGRRAVRPKPRHAELAVTLAGAMSTFLVATWNNREKKKKHEDSAK